MRLPDEQNVYHLFPVLCSRRNELQQYLKKHGVGTVIHYPIPPHKQECYREWNNQHYPITEQIAEQELSLPLGPSISIAEIDEITTIINKWS